ncbi:MAG: glutathionylspermidine synthase family protein [Gudongella sp.]|nr:glutathionylspermidine synthase family protein [Gudongella sp.]
MDSLKINNEYIDMVLKNQNRYSDDYRQTLDKVTNSTAIYKGKPVPFLYNPMFFTLDDEKNFSKIGQTMIEIGDKVFKKFVQDTKYREKFGFPEFIEELMLLPNNYNINVPIGRFDIFYKDMDNFKFCEINTDGSSAMNEDNTIGRVLLESLALKDFSKKYSLENRELIEKWVKRSIEIFGKWDSNNLKPNVAIVDFEESGTPYEFLEFKKAYEIAGYNCIIVDPRDLVYKDEKLYYEDYRIDLVYRRIVTFELIEKRDELKEFLKAYKENAMCVIGTIRSQLMHNKIFFKILHDKETSEFLSKEENEFVKNHIPYTGAFEGPDEILKKVMVDKDKYIMKPSDKNGSHGVFVGRDLSSKDWENRLESVFNEDYIYQEFVEPYKRDFLVYADGSFSRESFKSIVGIFMYKEEYAGLYTRISKDNIISGLTSYFTVPNIIAVK